MDIFLREQENLTLPLLWLERWQNVDPFWHVMHLQGKTYREQPGRKTLRFIEDGEAYFIKCHYGVGWKEIFKNILQGRLPVIGAKNEYLAIQRLVKFGFVPRIAGYGWRGKNPARQKSFLITKELSFTISLEDFCRHWPQKPPSLKLKWSLIRKVAEIARVMHSHGVNHRDFYLCHFLLDMTGGCEFLNPCALNLYLIDLHRAQLRRKVPFRWRVKDIAGLYFSAMDIGLTYRDMQRFAITYNGSKNCFFWHAVRKRALKLYRKTWRKLSPDIHLPFFLPLKQQHFLLATQLIRCLPERRMVVRGEWQGKAVLAKLFVKPRHALAELRGHQQLQQRGFSTPALLYHGWSQHQALYLVIYEYRQHATTFSTIFQQADHTTKKTWLRALITLVQQQHQAGLWQADLHFNNFLVEDNNLLTIDAASVRIQDKPLSLTQQNANLAQLFAQLPPDLNDLWDIVITPALAKAIIKAQKKRTKKYLAKVQRNCTTYCCKESFSHIFILNRNYDTPAFHCLISAIINKKITQTTLTVNNQILQIALFIPKSWRDYFTTPARRAWLNYHRQVLAERPGPAPVALIEKRCLFWKSYSCIITTQHVQNHN